MAGKSGKGGLREARERWERDILAPAMSKSRERRPRFESTSGEEVPRLYTPEHLASFDYLRDAGFPGEFPFTRGVQPTMYRGRFWTMRQYAGFGTAKESNERYKQLVAHGTGGLSVAFDLPTQMGHDSDSAIAHGEVGKVGVAIDSIRDMATLLDGIPLGEV
ncbi:MAG TPA: methylmalonyl-CoA mutase family protein, partial [Thermoanaerobaculia bacterium]|nr:methylmalonyl-CoA mutase family protein [Thermoanaerobaculia bacterium]